MGIRSSRIVTVQFVESDSRTMSTTEKRHPRRASGAKGGRVKAQKRRLFDELMAGVDDMRRQREGAITHRTRRPRP